MTAEIAIYNKSSIALAADSAVTLGETKKIYNSANKLFPLSKYHPVGIMVYGHGEFMGIPWETIIKVYRKRLGSKRYEYLKQYADDFCAFLESNQNYLFKTEYLAQFLQEHLRSMTIQYIRYLTEEVARGSVKPEAQVDDAQFLASLKSVINKELLKWENDESDSPITAEQLANALPTHVEVIKGVAEARLQARPDDEDLAKITRVVLLATAKRWSYTGVVVAGFGERNTFPCYIELFMYAVLNNKLMWKLGKHKIDANDYKAGIVPFADQNVVFRFVAGIDPRYELTIREYFSSMIKNYPRSILSTMTGNLTEEEKTKLLKKIEDISTAIQKDYAETFSNFERRSFINPIVDNLNNLPKDELAAMAESLVNITLFHKRISLEESETVGGPIDVAVISKGDGLIWIKRKHYFKPELNPHYLENYFRRDLSTQRRKANERTKR